jgi:hypothetical protein
MAADAQKAYNRIRLEVLVDDETADALLVDPFAVQDKL